MSLTVACVTAVAETCLPSRFLATDHVTTSQHINSRHGNICKAYILQSEIYISSHVSFGQAVDEIYFYTRTTKVNHTILLLIQSKIFQQHKCEL
jgi:hypothetical protein